MQNLLADLALESEAATALAFRLARGFDESEQSEQSKLFTRTATAIGKFWNCKRAVFAVGEAIEILGRQRLCRRFRSAATLPRHSGQFDLGRFGKCAVSRRFALDEKRAGKQSKRFLRNWNRRKIEMKFTINFY